MPSLRMEGRRSTVIDGGVGYATQQRVTAALSCVFPSDPDRNILPLRHICPFQACDKPILTSRGDNLILGMSVLRCKTGILYRNGMSRTYDPAGPVTTLHTTCKKRRLKVRIEQSWPRTTGNGSATSPGYRPMAMGHIPHPTWLWFAKLRTR